MISAIAFFSASCAPAVLIAIAGVVLSALLAYGVSRYYGSQAKIDEDLTLLQQNLRAVLNELQVKPQAHNSIAV